jgi:hypothetical protein
VSVLIRSSESLAAGTPDMTDRNRAAYGGIPLAALFAPGGTAMAKEENSRDMNETDRPLEDDAIGAAEDEDFDDEDDLDDEDDDEEGEV